MRFLKFFILLTGSVCLANAQDSGTNIITNNSEANGVLGGWPPKNFGKGSQNSTVNSILRGTAKANTTAPTLAQNTTSRPKGSAPKPIARTSQPAPRPTTPRQPLKLPVLPSSDDKPDPISRVDSKLLSTSPLVLPPLPQPIDRLTPVLNDRPPRPPRKRVHSLYTLGAGDTVTFATFERSDLSRTVRIAPDGTVSYLQAIAVSAKGLTVDQLRDKMEIELKKFRRDFKLIVTPQGIQSKEYAVLGRVQQPGTFPIERPITVLEAIARAQGVEQGTIRGSSYALADFDKSFVSRGGRKLDVNMSKLYEEGDMKQNVTLQPNDYVYIASILKKEFYILGAVNNPGLVKITDRLTVASAIALAGGFQNSAYKMKVLLIRGDLETPETHVINVRDILRGTALDQPIKSNDIIFVARRPFDVLERVVDSAITTYVQTLTAEALNRNFTPITGN